MPQTGKLISDSKYLNLLILAGKICLITFGAYSFGLLCLILTNPEGSGNLVLLPLRIEIVACIAIVSAFQAILTAYLTKKNLSKPSESVGSKNYLLANLAHEIKTPLTAILGFSEQIQDASLNKERKREATETIINNANHLLNLINDILDFSKIEAGKLKVNTEECDLSQILSFIKTTFQNAADKKGLSLGIEIISETPRIIKTDSVRLIQILMNLIGNAIKFTSSGGVKVIVDYDKSNNNLYFKVVDTGIGLTEDQKKNLFKEFSQADTSITKNFGGTGLGLAISKKLANLLGGDISAESTHQNGSTFTAVIKISPPAHENYIKELSESDRQRKINTIPSLSGNILLVEDGLENQRLLQNLIEKTGLRVCIAENGLLALEKLKNQNFNMIIMDMQMPVMDGYIATEHIRSAGSNIPIIACTADNSKENIARCLKIGCNDIIFKPFDKETLFSVLKKYSPTDPNLYLSEKSSDYELNSIKDDFISGIPEKLKELKVAIDGNNYLKIKQLAHSLAVAGMFGISELGNLALALEDFAGQEKDELIKNKFQEIVAFTAQIN